MTLQEAIDEFLTGCLAEGKARTTVRWYKQRLGRLLGFFGDIPLESVKAADLRRFLVDLRGRSRLFEDNPYRQTVEGSLSPHTLASYVWAIKAFYNWLEKEEYITTAENIALRLKKPALPKAAPKEAASVDVRSLLEAAGETPCFPKRNVAIIWFLCDTGCRVGGLVNLRMADLELHKSRALLTEKGGKSRYVFLEPPAQKALEDWLEVRPSKDDSDFVFVGKRGPLTVYGVNQMLSKLKKKLGIKGRVNPHSFRHGFAKRYLDAGGDLASLSDLMGHTDIAVTKNSYSVFLTDELQRKHAQHSPIKELLDD